MTWSEDSPSAWHDGDVYVMEWTPVIGAAADETVSLLVEIKEEFKR